MIKRKFGKTDIEVSALGYGAGHIGRDELDEEFVGYLLNEIVNRGINLIDTARGYGKSEERIGRHLSYRRSDFVLSTKVGYGIDGFSDWTYDCILKGVDEALLRMQTDYIDIVHLHSCNIDILKSGAVIDALEKLKREGTVKAIAYSGENEALEYAVNTGRFDSVESSLNICDQRIISERIPDIEKKGLGFIAKRPIANAPWRFEEIPHGNYAEEYWKRLHEMDIVNEEIAWAELFLRFSAFTKGVSSAIVGSLNLKNIDRNIESLEKGELDRELYNKLKAKFKEKDNNWIGQI